MPGVAGAAAGIGPVQELRLIALFVSKWKLDPTKTRLIFAKQSPNRRRYLMQKFTTQVTGEGATAALESFVAECNRTGVWDEGAGGQQLPTSVPTQTQPGLSGIKR